MTDNTNLANIAQALNSWLSDGASATVIQAWMGEIISAPWSNNRKLASCLLLQALLQLHSQENEPEDVLSMLAEQIERFAAGIAGHAVSAVIDSQERA